jgi:hypothetical protein
MSDAETRLLNRRCRCGKGAAEREPRCAWHAAVSADYAADLLRHMATDASRWRHAKRWHRPRFYRYRKVYDQGIRLAWNRYDFAEGRATIGAALLLGHYTYCVKWADAELVRTGGESDG